MEWKGDNGLCQWWLIPITGFQYLDHILEWKSRNESLIFLSHFFHSDNQLLKECELKGNSYS